MAICYDSGFRHANKKQLMADSPSAPNGQTADECIPGFYGFSRMFIMFTKPLPEAAHLDHSVCPINKHTDPFIKGKCFLVYCYVCVSTVRVEIACG